jgi:Tol biopolymer transport system component
VTFSPDNQRVAFARRPDVSGESALIVMSADGTNERKLATRHLPERFGAPAWSPNGKALFYSVANISAGYSFLLFEMPVEGGKETQISPQRWWSVGRPVWLSDGRGMVMTAADQPDGLRQVWHVSYPDGQARRVTNDLGEYENISLTADFGILVGVENNRQLYVSIAPNGDASRAVQIMSGDGSLGSPTWTPDNRIVYSSMAGSKRAIWIMDAEGKNQKQLTAEADASQFPKVSLDGRYIVFQAYSAGAFNIWRMDIDGSNGVQLTDDNGNFPTITPDAKWVVYQKFGANGGQIWRVPIAGGAPVQITDEKVNAVFPLVSPNGKMIVCGYSSATHPSSTPAAVFRTAVIPIDGGEPIKIFDTPGGLGSGISWNLDSSALTYVVTRDGVSNIWSQPLDGSNPKQLTEFKTDQIFAYDWSRDSKQLLLLRGTISSDVVMLSDFK